MLAIDEADVILFVVDVMNGVTDLDMEVAEILRRSKTPVLLVANKRIITTCSIMRLSFIP